MKRKLLATLLTCALTATALIGCQSTTTETQSNNTNTEAKEDSTDGAAENTKQKLLIKKH